MKDTRVLVETAIIVAMAFVIEVVFKAIPSMPFGGGYSLAALPIIILSWRRGIVPGVVAGFIFSILNMFLDGFSPAAWAITWQVFIAAMFLDYFIAFGVLGLAGILKKPFGNSIIVFSAGILLANGLRFIMHLISGIVLWSEWAPEGQSAFMYSFIYNGTYMLPNAILCLIVGIAIFTPLKPYLDLEDVA